MDVNELKQFTPGPVRIPLEVLEIGAVQLPYNRTEQFSELTYEIIAGLKYVFQTNGDVAIFTASGTGAMEACIANFLDKNDRVLIVNGGIFGQRWVDLCVHYEVPFQQIKLEPGSSLSPEIIEHELSKEKYFAVLLNAHETSTGVLYDTQEVGKVCDKYSALFIVDAISSICADTFLMDDWLVDVALLSSHKGLALPPGLSFVALNDRAKQLLQSKRCRSFYFDIKNVLENQTRGQMPYTPAIGLFLMLHKRLSGVRAQKIDSIITDHQRLAKHFRVGLQELPFEMLPTSPSNALTAVQCGPTLNAFDFVKRLKAETGYVIAANGGELSETIFRVSHMGQQTVKDIDLLLHALENTVAKGC